MSTIPLSKREGHGQTISGEPPKPLDDDGEAVGKLDGLADQLADAILTRNEPKQDAELLPPIEGGDTWSNLSNDPEREKPSGRDAGLEKSLRASESRVAEREQDSNEFHRAREARETLRHRYKGAVSLEALLENATAWHERLSENPGVAADQLASAYLQMSPYAFNDNHKPTAAEPPADEHPSKKLDRILEGAIDKARNGDVDAKEFKASAKQRAALKKMFPGASFAEALASVVQFDADMHKDPLTTAVRMAACYGMPITSGQQSAAQAYQERAAPVLEMIDQTAPHLPNFADYQEDMTRVLSHRDFARTADLQQDMLRAYRIVELVRQEQGRQKAEIAERGKPKPRGGLDGKLDAAFAQHGWA